MSEQTTKTETSPTEGESSEVDCYEEGYEVGNRAAWRMMLLECLGRLGETPEDPVYALARLTAVHEETIQSLQVLCEELDIVWDDELYLPDMIEKRILRTIMGGAYAS